MLQSVVETLTLTQSIAASRHEAFPTLTYLYTFQFRRISCYWSCCCPESRPPPFYLSLFFLDCSHEKKKKERRSERETFRKHPLVTKEEKKNGCAAFIARNASLHACPTATQRSHRLCCVPMAVASDMNASRQAAEATEEAGRFSKRRDALVRN